MKKQKNINKWEKCEEKKQRGEKIGSIIVEG